MILLRKNALFYDIGGITGDQIDGETDG